MKLSIGVFSWSIPRLCDKVTELEKNGDYVKGYEIVKLPGYQFEKHDRLVFLDYQPDVLEAWKAKGDIGKAEIVMPDEPRKFGDPTPAKANVAAPTKQKPQKTEKSE